MVKKHEHEKKEGAKERPKHEKESVKKLIEEKMEKIRKQELVKAEQKEQKKEGDKSRLQASEGEKEKPATKKESTFKLKAKPLPTSVFVTGKRKRAVARAYFKPGKGIIRVNSVPIELVMPDMFRLKMTEPLIVIGDGWKRFDAKITVNGGGPSGQADAVRQVIARGLSELIGPEARKAFLSYDRNLIVYDSRRTEPHKPPRSSQGPRRYKQRSKR